MFAFSPSRALRGTFVALGLIALGTAAQATGLATCESGDKSTWQAKDKLEQTLKERGWTVRRIKEDGGCYEVYALDEKGQRGEYYFHPVTLQSVPTKPRN
ncbi:MAG: PepSY domain-containing protein [Burkholderiaceae bacterium]